MLLLLSVSSKSGISVYFYAVTERERQRSEVVVKDLTLGLEPPMRMSVRQTEIHHPSNIFSRTIEEGICRKEVANKTNAESNKNKIMIKTYRIIWSTYSYNNNNIQLHQLH